MDSITFNKEIIRRICILNGGSICYISHSKGDDFLEVLADIKTDKLENFTKELKEWSGVNYKAYALDNNEIGKLKHINQQILPIS